MEHQTTPGNSGSSTTGTKFKLPLPPPLNTVYRTTRNGRMYKSHEAKDYAKDIATQLELEEIVLGDISLEIDFFINRDRDIDSGLKVLLDALQDVLYKNDSQITVLNVTKQKVIKGDEPFCFVTLSQI